MSQTVLTLDEASQRLKQSVRDISNASHEILNKKNAVMFSQEEVEKLETHFKEKHKPRLGSIGRQRPMQGGAAGGLRPPRRGLNSSVVVERRKQRGVQVKRPILVSPALDKKEEVVAKPAEVVSPVKVKKEIAQVPAPTSDVIQKQQDKKAMLRDKIFEQNSQKAIPSPKPEVVEPKKSNGAPPADYRRKKSNYSADRKTLSVDKATVVSRERRKIRRRSSAKSAPNIQKFQQPSKEQQKVVEIPPVITVRELALRLAVKTEQIMSKLVQLVDDASTIDQIDQETAVIIVEELGHVAKKLASDRLSEFEEKIKSKPGDKIVSRPPIVTVMGHVDHGKTTLLDFIRNTQVAGSESGGITQHIGAYQVDTPEGKITMIDTPGHEVFSSMRARGSKVTDIVVLVVASDDGVQPQTIEAIAHAKNDDVEIIVAVNKMDLPGADVKPILTELATHGLQPEEWGGDTIVVPIVALTGLGVDKLLSTIALSAEMLELKAPVDVEAYGTVLEAKTEKGIGQVIFGIVRSGILKPGQFLLCDTEYGRIRAIRDENGKTLKEAYPSMPVQILGISYIQKVGNEFFVADTESEARELAKNRKHESWEHQNLSNRKEFNATSVEEMLANQKAEEEEKILTIVLKTDVTGTNEAMQQALAKIGNEESRIKVVLNGVGGISESDVNMAQASGAVVIGFRVTANSKARKLINDFKIESFFHDVFYEVTDFIKAKLEGMLQPVVQETPRGAAQIKEVFSIHKVGKIAGCGVIEGSIDTKFPVRIVRDGIIVNKTKISELRSFKKIVKIVKSGSECGIFLERFSDFKPGDRIESYEEVVTRQKL